MIDFALPGCGRIVKRHADLLGTGRIPGARLAAVCDDDRKRMAGFAERYQVRGCESLDDLLALPGIEVVSVLTPSGMHADHAARALKAGMGNQSRILSLPIFPEMSPSHVDTLEQALLEFGA